MDAANVIASAAPQAGAGAAASASATNASAAVVALRRLEDKDVRSVFECLHEGKPPPPNIQFKIVPVGSNGLKLSPPSHEFPDGLYVLLRPRSKSSNKNSSSSPPKVPSHLLNLVMRDRDLPPETCPWSLSGPQFPQPTAIQQRYCYPKGRPEYSSRKGGALWTMYRKDGKEDVEFRLLHVYFSAKRAINKGCSDVSDVVGGSGAGAAAAPAASTTLPSAATRTEKPTTGGSFGSPTKPLSMLSPVSVRRNNLKSRSSSSTSTSPGHPSNILPLTPQAYSHHHHHLKSPAITASTAATNSPSSTTTCTLSCSDSPLSFAAPSSSFPPLSPDHNPPHHHPHHQLWLPPFTTTSTESGASNATSNFVSPSQQQHHYRHHHQHDTFLTSSSCSSPFRSNNRDGGGGGGANNNSIMRGSDVGGGGRGGLKSPPSDYHSFFDERDDHTLDTNDDDEGAADSAMGDNSSYYRYMEPFPYDMEASDDMLNMEDTVWNDPLLNVILKRSFSSVDAQPSATITRRHQHSSSDSAILNLSSKLDMVHESIQDAILASPTATEQSAMLNYLANWARRVAADPLTHNASYCHNNSNSSRNNNSTVTTGVRRPSRTVTTFGTGESGGVDGGVSHSAGDYGDDYDDDIIMSDGENSHSLTAV